MFSVTKKVLLQLLILPVVITFLSFFLIKFRGPFYYAQSSDPAYVYLVSSLDVATFNFDMINHTDHPGTPLQIFGAVILRCLHPLANNNELITKVFTFPEYYISIIVYTLVIVNFLVFLFIGQYVYRVLKKVKYALLLQAMFLFSGLVVYDSLGRLRPETPLIFIFQIISTYLAVRLIDTKLGYHKNVPFVLGALIGLSIALKFTAIPLLILPLLFLSNIKDRIKYLLTIPLSFLIFIFPVINKIPKLLEWIAVNILSTEAYGTGTFGAWTVTGALRGIDTAAGAEPILLFAPGFLIVVLAALLAVTKRDKKILKDIHLRYAVAAVIVFLIQLNMFFKHTALRYLLPAVMVSVPFYISVWYLCWDYLPSFKRITTLYRVKLETGLTIFLLLFSIAFFSIYLEIAHKYTITNYANSHYLSSSKTMTLFAYMCSSRLAGLYMGNSYSNNFYSSHLKEIYGDAYAFVAWKRPFRIEHFGQDVKLDALLDENKEVQVCGLGPIHTLFEEYLEENGYEYERLSLPKLRYTSDEVTTVYKVQKL